MATFKKQFKGIKHLVLVGIGGSNLGTEAIHLWLITEKLSCIHWIPFQHNDIELLINKLKPVRSVKQLVVCVIRCLEILLRLW